MSKKRDQWLKMLAKIQEERILSDTELIRDGAEVSVDEKGNWILMPTKLQKIEIKNDAADEKRLLAVEPECYSVYLKKIINVPGGLKILIEKLKTDAVFVHNFSNNLKRIIESKNTDAVVNRFRKAMAEGLEVDAWKYIRLSRESYRRSKRRGGNFMSRSGAALYARDYANYAKEDASLIKKLLTEAGEQKKGEEIKMRIGDEVLKIFN